MNALVNLVEYSILTFHMSVLGWPAPLAWHRAGHQHSSTAGHGSCPVYELWQNSESNKMNKACDKIAVLDFVGMTLHYKSKGEGSPIINIGKANFQRREGMQINSKEGQKYPQNNLVTMIDNSLELTRSRPWMVCVSLGPWPSSCGYSVPSACSSPPPELTTGTTSACSPWAQWR